MRIYAKATCSITLTWRRGAVLAPALKVELAPFNGTAAASFGVGGPLASQPRARVVTPAGQDPGRAPSTRLLPTMRRASMTAASGDWRAKPRPPGGIQLIPARSIWPAGLHDRSTLDRHRPIIYNSMLEHPTLLRRMSPGGHACLSAGSIVMPARRPRQPGLTENGGNLTSVMAPTAAISGQCPGPSRVPQSATEGPGGLEAMSQRSKGDA
jgi:hypothetical protein